MSLRGTIAVIDLAIYVLLHWKLEAFLTIFYIPYIFDVKYNGGVTRNVWFTILDKIHIYYANFHLATHSLFPMILFVNKVR